MGRYVRVVLSLAVLALVYYRLGGFGPAGPDSSPVDEAPPASPTTAESTVSPPQTSVDIDKSAPMAKVASVPVFAEPEAPQSSETVTIGRGESFYVALQRAGLEHETIMSIVKACKPHTNLRRVKRGDEFELARTEDGAFRSLRFELDAEHYLDVIHGDAGMNTEISSYPVERIVKGVRGTIETNLFDALREQDADPVLAGLMADILGWDVDFFRDLRKGDEFVLLYEEYTYEDRKVRDGQILAARLANRGETHEAFLFENAFDLPSYYDEEGDSLEKQFLRAPLKFSRISSGFARRRLHPVLKSYRPHYGVDYVAPTGTPVLATADGVVIKRERAKGNGNYVGLRHGQGYESYYLHLSKFPSGMKRGDKVKQGDVIGFVGQTGWATAPHLDYRIKKGGKWTDPRKLKLPPAAPVPDERREEYEALRDRLLAQLETVPGDAPTVVLEGTPAAETISTVD